MDWIVGFMDDDIGSSFGPGSAARADFPGYGGLENVCLPPALQAHALTYSDSGISGHYGNGNPVDSAGADSVGRLVGNRLVEALSDTNKILTALAITDDDVEPDNRIKLSSLPYTQHGPRARVEVQHRNRSQRKRSFYDTLPPP